MPEQGIRAFVDLIRRLPSSWSHAKKMEKVEEVLSVLKLKHIENSVVGDENKRGVSGGEKKRVSIGIELVADPKILFLDEPTTGLDATTAKELMQFLQTVASTGVNVICVIHQPRYVSLYFGSNYKDSKFWKCALNFFYLAKEEKQSTSVPQTKLSNTLRAKDLPALL